MLLSSRLPSSLSELRERLQTIFQQPCSSHSVMSSDPSWTHSISCQLRWMTTRSVLSTVLRGFSSCNNQSLVHLQHNCYSRLSRRWCPLFIRINKELTGRCRGQNELHFCCTFPNWRVAWCIALTWKWSCGDVFDRMLRSCWHEGWQWVCWRLSTSCWRDWWTELHFHLADHCYEGGAKSDFHAYIQRTAAKFRYCTHLCSMVGGMAWDVPD